MSEKDQVKEYLKKHAEGEKQFIQANVKLEAVVKEHEKAIEGYAPDEKIRSLLKEIQRLRDIRTKCQYANTYIEGWDNALDHEEEEEEEEEGVIEEEEKEDIVEN
ncbi:hypothetical protein EDD11_008511 [Mortierella claussenii]|nr:hypothetical protein EDD11_008511 [Mortierella claussenii]